MEPGTHGAVEYQLRNEPRKLAAYAPLHIANASWTVVVNTPLAQVTAYARESFGKVILLLAMLGGAFSLVGVLVYHSHLSRVKAEQESAHWQEKHRLEERIRRAEERYRTLFEQSPDGILMLDAETLLPMEFNEAAHRHLGYTRAEFTCVALSDYDVGDETHTTAERLARLQPQQSTSFETAHRTQSGEMRNVEVLAQKLMWANRAVFHCLYHDVTERTRTRRLLEQRTARLTALHQVSSSIAAEMEPDTLYQTITSQVLPLFQGSTAALYLYKPEEQSLALIAGAGLERAAVRKALNRGEDLVGKVWESGTPLAISDYTVWEGRTNANGKHTCASAMAAPLRWNDQILGVLGICSEAAGSFSKEDAALLGLLSTEAAIAIKNAALLQQVRQDALTKTTLLYDVNHRVKNNLLRLVEILRLEQQRHADPSSPVAIAFDGLEKRLRGMAVVHTMLSETKWNPLPLKELVNQIIDGALSGSPVSQQIQVSVTAPPDPIWLLPEQASAVALIFNELVTNSVKHAFANCRAGCITVNLELECRVKGRPLLRLEYRDDGPGWPEEVLAGRGQQVGLHLIRTSVRSPLCGNLHLRNENGAMAVIHFQLAVPDPKETSL
jgi:PAS domain S-box-containing protein